MRMSDALVDEEVTDSGELRHSSDLSELAEAFLTQTAQPLTHLRHPVRNFVLFILLEIRPQLDQDAPLREPVMLSLLRAFVT